MEEDLRCPLCGAWLDEDDVLYVREDGTAAGCGSCIHEEYGWQRAPRAAKGEEDERDTNA